MKNILGLKIVSHDTGAAVLSGGKIVAIAEERLNRVKHSFDMFPHLAINYCLDVMNLKAEDIDMVVIDQIHTKERIPMERIFRRETGERFNHAKLEVINHHDAHAASAFFCSPFDSAAVIVYDGSGEEFRTPLGVNAVETETIYYGEGNTLTELQKSLHTRVPPKRFLYTFGAGRLYSHITDYIGFGNYQEGKTMGLAPYGKPGTFKEAPEKYWWKEWHGNYLCNANIRFPKTLINKKAPLIGRIRFGIKARMYAFGIMLSQRMMGKDFMHGAFFDKPLAFSKPRRQDSVTLPDEYYTNVAYAVQNVLEKVVKGWAHRAKEITRAEKLCIAGGVGLNSVANKKILDECGFEDVWIQPACSDTGIALGCVLYAHHMILKQPRFWQMNHAYMGREYSENEIEDAIKKNKTSIKVRKSNDTAADAAKLLAQGKIIGWFQGKSEYGPRALGHRSILVDARGKDKKDVLNKRVKHREEWRPFAVSVLAERAGEYFDVDRESPHMLMVSSVRNKYRNEIPAVVHVDWTCRVQTVNKKDNDIYYDLIKAFDDETGTPLILNTSYNVAGEPIIESPEDAIRCFLGTDIDYLVLHDYFVTKK